MILHLDYETYSAADIRKVGGIRYSEDPSTEILLMGYALNDDPAKVWAPCLHGTLFDDPEMLELLGLGFVDTGPTIPDDLYEAMMDPTCLVYAHNAHFEKAITDNVGQDLGVPSIPIHRWRCTAAIGRSLALPSSLDGLAKALKFAPGSQKDKEGKPKYV